MAARHLSALVLALALGLPLAWFAHAPAEPGPGRPAAPAPARQLPPDPRPLPAGALGRLGFTRGDTLAARAEIISAAYSGDGRTLATGAWRGAPDRTGYELWDADTGAARGLVPSPVGGSYGVSPSADGRRLAWGGNAGDHALTGVTDAATGTVLWQARGGNQVAYTADGRHVVAGSYGGQTVVLDAATGRLVHTLSDPDRFANSFVLSHDGTTVVASTERRRDPREYAMNKARVEVWDVATGRRRKVAAERDYTFGTRQALAVTSDGTAVGYTENKTLTVADVSTGAARWAVENPGGNHVWEFVVFSPADDMLVALRTRYDAHPAVTTLDLLDAATGRVARTFDGAGYQFNRAAFSPDGRRVVTYGEGAPVRVWDVATGRAVPAYDGHRAPVAAVAVSGDGGTVVSADWYTLCVWNPPGLRRRLDLRYVGSLGLSGDARTAVLTVNPGTVLLLDPAAGEPRVLTQTFVECVAVSPGGTRAALSRGGHGIDLVELPSGKTLRTLTGHPGAVYALSFSADGQRLLSAARTRPPALGMEKPRPDGTVGELPPPAPDDTVRVWEVETGKELRRWERAASAAALTADGRVLLAGCEDGQVRRLMVGTGEELPPVVVSRGAVTAVAVSADGRRAAAAGSGGIVVWDAATGREVRQFRPDHGGVAALAFTADGRRLVSAGADGTILLWEVPPGP